MKESTQITIILILTAIVAFTLFFSYMVYTIEQEDKACKRIGFEEYIFRMGMQYCKDSMGNLHYVDQECDFFGSNCKAREIFVGDVRVISEGGNEDERRKIIKEVF